MGGAPSLSLNIQCDSDLPRHLFHAPSVLVPVFDLEVTEEASEERGEKVAGNNTDLP